MSKSSKFATYYSFSNLLVPVRKSTKSNVTTAIQKSISEILKTRTFQIINTNSISSVTNNIPITIIEKNVVICPQ